MILYTYHKGHFDCNGRGVLHTYLVGLLVVLALIILSLCGIVYVSAQGKTVLLIKHLGGGIFRNIHNCTRRRNGAHVYYSFPVCNEGSCKTVVSFHNTAFRKVCKPCPCVNPTTA